MIDERLRQIERARSLGDVDVRALVVARARAGQLPPGLMGDLEALGYFRERVVAEDAVVLGITRTADGLRLVNRVASEMMGEVLRDNRTGDGIHEFDESLLPSRATAALGLYEKNLLKHGVRLAALTPQQVALQAEIRAPLTALQATLIEHWRNTGQPGCRPHRPGAQHDPWLCHECSHLIQVTDITFIILRASGRLGRGDAVGRQYHGLAKQVESFARFKAWLERVADGSKNTALARAQAIARVIDELAEEQQNHLYVAYLRTLELLTSLEAAEPGFRASAKLAARIELGQRLVAALLEQAGLGVPPLA